MPAFDAFALTDLQLGLWGRMDGLRIPMNAGHRSTHTSKDIGGNKAADQHTCRRGPAASTTTLLQPFAVPSHPSREPQRRRLHSLQVLVGRMLRLTARETIPRSGGLLLQSCPPPPRSEDPARRSSLPGRARSCWTARPTCRVLKEPLPAAAQGQQNPHLTRHPRQRASNQMEAGETPPTRPPSCGRSLHPPLFHCSLSEPPCAPPCSWALLSSKSHLSLLPSPRPLLPPCLPAGSSTRLFFTWRARRMLRGGRNLGMPLLGEILLDGADEWAKTAW